MADLDFTSPYDELCELREVFTASQIAELTGLRRETISRARPDSHFRRSTEKVISDLHTVVTRMRSANEGDLGQLAAVLRRPQTLLGGRSIADLLREGEIDAALEHLAPPAPSEMEQLENLRLAPEVEEELRALENESTAGSSIVDSSNDQRVASLLAADRQLARTLEAIEGMAHEVFGAELVIRREAVTDASGTDGGDRLYMRLRSELAFDDELDLLIEFFDRADGILAPVEDRLTVGNL